MAMIHLNGKLVPEHLAVVSCHDRGFLYGDGLFETVLILQAHPFRLQRHLERLRCGLDFLQLNPGVTDAALVQAIEDLIRANAADDAVLRIAISRGIGSRGYSADNAGPATVVLSLHPLTPVDPRHPVEWKLKTASVRLPTGQALTRHKTANKLLQILARQESDAAGMNDALLLNDRGNVAECASGNVFWMGPDGVVTPPVDAGVLPGITREVVLELCAGLNIPAHEGDATPEEFRAAEAAFMTLSTLGVVEVVAVDGAPLKRSPLVGRLHQAYQKAIRQGAGVSGQKSEIRSQGSD